MSRSAFDIEVDDLILARARSGELAAYEILFRLFHRPSYSIAFRVCQCPDLAQDIIQEAFITAFRRIRQFRGDSPFWGWLRRVVVNHAISALRKLPRQNTLELDESHAVQAGEDARIELAIDLEGSLAELDAEDRAVVWLHDVEGYSHKEIATFFGMTESFSKTRLSRARARLRSWLDPSLHQDADNADSSASADQQGPVSSTAQDTAAGSSASRHKFDSEIPHLERNPGWQET